MGLGRVLVVDDDACLRQMLRLILTKAGYDVVEAEEGEKGVAKVVRCPQYPPPIGGSERGDAGN